MILTPIGTSPAWYRPDEASSGYLLEADNYRLLVDCGSGVLMKYFAMYPNEPLQGVHISHLHADHSFDLVPLKYYLQFGGGTLWPRPTLWMPEGVEEELLKMTDVWTGGDREFWRSSFDVVTYNENDPYQVGPFSCQSREVPHYVPTWATRFTHHGKSFLYSADCGPNDALCELGKDVDLAVIEASLPDASYDGTARGHMSAVESGEHAEKMQAKSLLLTHIAAEIGDQFQIDNAKTTYQGPVDVAQSGHTYSL